MPANRKNLLLAAGLFLLAGALHEAEILLPPALRSTCFLAVTLLYLGLSLGWAASIAQRIMHRTVRRLLIACAALAALWIVLRTCKYRFFDAEAVCLMLWYFYYLPQLFAPVLMLLAALHLGRREEEAVSPRWYLLLAPAAALFLGIATNNRHELAFRFFPPQSRPDVYAHGPLYFTAVALMLVMMAAGVGVVFARSRVPSGRRFIWLPGAVFLAGFALCLLSFANVLTAFKVPEMFCATFIATWECCMQVGLLPSNTNYGGFFSASTICAQLDDAQGNVVLRSAQPLSLTAAQRRQAREGALMLTPDLRLGAHAIPGGAILYAESIAGINRIRDQLQATARRAPRSLRLLSALPCALCAALLCALMDGRAQGFDAPGALPFTGAAGRLSPCALILALATMAAVLAVALSRLRAWQRDHLSAASVKEGLDRLPAGLCFYVRDGLPQLVNVRMDALCCALTGGPLMNGEVFWQRLCAGDVAPGCEVLATGDAPILRTPDGRVWSFVRSGIRVGGQSARQIVASDVTQEHAMNRQLHEENRRVAQLNLRLRRYGEQIRELTREKETLAARVRIHDDFGQALLAARRLGAQQGDARQREQVLALWRTSLALLRGTGEKEPPAAGLGALV